MQSIPLNCWGTFDRAIPVQRTAQSLVLESDHLVYRGCKIEAKSHWWSWIPQVVLSPLLFHGWNYILYKLGFVTLCHNQIQIDVKIAELRNKLLLHTESISKAYSQDKILVLVEDQIDHLENLNNTGEIPVDAISWADQVMISFGIIENRNYTDTLIRIHLIPEQIHYYQILQERISLVVAHEWDRPGIEVEISRPYVVARYTSCIGGGVGPKSDAAIITKAIEKISLRDEGNEAWKSGRIIVYSAPAPCRGIKQWRNLPKLFSWMRRTEEFLTRWQHSYSNQFTCYTLASNTVHIYFQAIKALTEDRLVNLIDIFTEAIVEIIDKEVLILGTSKAYHYKLYPSAFLRKGGKYRTIDKKVQRIVQEIIDHTKNKPSPSVEVMESLKKIIESYAATHSYILLGCTELPMVLNYMGEFKKEVEKRGILLIDTEDVIALQIALNFINQNSPRNQINAMRVWLASKQVSK